MQAARTYDTPDPATDEYVAILDTTVGDKLEVRVDDDPYAIIRAGDIVYDEEVLPLFLHVDTGDRITFAEREGTLRAARVGQSLNGYCELFFFGDV